MDFVPNTKNEQKAMLKAIGAESMENLFIDIPDEKRLNKELDIPKGRSEQEVKEHMRLVSEKNCIHKSIFRGAGSYNHFIPSYVNHLVSRSEFSTAYTPYQPEISQGLLQAIYEYQTMICNITGMDVTNASMYDGASALAESMAMALAAKRKRNKIIVSKTVHPGYRKVLKTYSDAGDVELVEIEYDQKTGSTDMTALLSSIDEDTAAVIVQSPNFFGVIEDVTKASGLAHGKDALLIMNITDPTSLGILKSPGELGADIAVAEGQSFGNPMSSGGPYLGIIACKTKYIRQLPGRIVGATTDSEGKKGYVLTLQAREQHIRRERAICNICSNESLCALAATIYLAGTGKRLSDVARQSVHNAHHLSENLTGISGINTVFEGQFFHEFVIKVKDAKKTDESLMRAGMIGGYLLENEYPELKDCMLFCATEANSQEEIRLLSSAMEVI